jgi:hypothetical protein
MFKILSFAVFFLVAFSSLAQYTETINSNRPGFSYGAYSVGTNVIQGEMGFRYGNDEHDLLNREKDIFDVDYSLRYGLYYERLEILLDGTYASENVMISRGLSSDEFSNRNFRRNTLGAKYLIYDRYLQKELEGPNVISWKAENTFQWDNLIPSVSAYAGANLLFGDNPFKFQEEPFLSPRLGIITQNNYKNWVFVMNFIADKFTTDFPSYEGIFTLTHTISRDIALFTEFQFIINDLYSDEIVRAGAGYLLLDDLQIDASFMVNFRDTPARWYVGLGVSYRYDDLHEGKRIFKNKVEKQDAKRKKKIEKKKKELNPDVEELKDKPGNRK